MMAAAGAVAACEAWSRALVARDVAALDGLLGDCLRYIHSTGAVHDRAGYLGFVGNGPYFLEVELRELMSHVCHDVVVLSGRLHLLLQRAGETATTQLTPIAVQVWRRSGERWRLEFARTVRAAD
jgi:ketosteroid isomerase-like protein